MHSLLIFVKLFQVCDFQQLSSPVKNEFVRSHLPATYPVFRRFSLVADGQIISCNFKPSLRLLYAIHPMEVKPIFLDIWILPTEPIWQELAVETVW